jgi:hypothetical protein
MIRAAKIEPDVFDEVEHDRSATRQAALVVLLVAAATGVGLGEGAFQFVVGGLLALGAWVLWAWLIYFVGTRLLPVAQTEAD